MSNGLLAQLLSTYGYWAVLIVIGLESMGIPLPGETMLIVAAIYAGATHNLQIEVIILAAAAGAILGDNLGFAIGHFGGFPLLRRYGRYIRLDERRLKLGRYIFQMHGSKVVFFGRFVSILRTYAAFLAGVNRMPWPQFLVFNASGGIVWATAWGVAAFYLGRQIERLSRPADIALGIAGAAALVAFLVFLRQNESRLADEAELAMPGRLEPG
ncbi:MAG: DedA family protein [Candidatus Dormibacteraeota bacterium]|nr:DedA family protein [Candidatus Dormibacteraeota bacterium]